MTAHEGTAVEGPPAQIPQFPGLRPLELGDRKVVAGLLEALQPQQSELTFTNLYMWRQAYSLRLSRLAEALLIFSWRPDPEDSFLFPPLGPGANADVVRQALRFLEEHGHAARLARVTEADLQRLGVTEDEFSLVSARAHWDYVYLVKDLIELRGNRYHKKRNHIEQFRRVHEGTYRPLTQDLVPACQELQDRWCDEKHCDLYATLHAEARAVKEVLANFEALGVTGGCIETKGRIEAFSLGEMLNRETVVIHVEKANADFHGLYQVMDQEFLQHAWPSVPFANREQDLADPGLRQAKQSYHPHHMVEKFEVHLK